MSFLLGVLTYRYVLNEQRSLGIAGQGRGVGRLRMRKQRKRRRTPLSRELIVEVALEIIVERGFDALTMRSVAKELDTSPAALYVYFANRQCLLDVLIDHALADVDVTRWGCCATWEDRLEEIATRTIDSLIKYPGLSRGMVGRVPSTESILKISETYLRVLIDAGCDEVTAVLAVDALNMLAVSEANEICAFDAMAGRKHLHEAEGTLSGLEPEAFPHLTRLAHLAITPTPEDRARWAVRTFIRGIAEGIPSANRSTQV